MFLAKRFLTAATRQPCFVHNLTSSFRALCVTPKLQQQNPNYAEKATEQNKCVTKAEVQECESVFQNVNQMVAEDKHGRLFAVVHLCGKQFKITAGDIILVEGYWPPTIGDEVRLEKVLIAGAKDFTLIGRPILEAGLVDVKATIIEKTLTHTKTVFKKKRRKQYQRINFQRSPNTMIRINSIEIGGKVNETKEDCNAKRLF